MFYGDAAVSACPLLDASIAFDTAVNQPNVRVSSALATKMPTGSIESGPLKVWAVAPIGPPTR